MISTLSRTGLLAGVAVVVAVAGIHWRELRSYWRPLLLGLPTAAVIVVAGGDFLINHSHPYFHDVARSLIGKPPQWSKPENVQADAQKPLVPIVAPPGGDTRCDRWTIVLQGFNRAKACAWLSPTGIDDIERKGISTAGTRIVLALRAVAAFIDSPWTGYGIDKAFAFRPHNTLLLFALAYGVLGLLVLPVFGYLVFWRLGRWRKIPFLAALSCASLFSHDLFLSHDVVAVLVVGMGAGLEAE